MVVYERLKLVRRGVSCGEVSDVCCRELFECCTNMCEGRSELIGNGICGVGIGEAG